MAAAARRLARPDAAAEVARELLEAAGDEREEQRRQGRDEPLGEPWSERRLHFVGVGGAGMSGYARAAHALGAQVSGSDRADSPYLERLRADGVLTREHRPRRRQRARGRRGRGHLLERRPSREPRARGGARARPARAPPRRAARGADARCGARSRSPARTARRRPRRCSCTRCAARACDPGWLVGRRGRRRAAQRATGSAGRVAGGGGRRVRPLDAEPRRWRSRC